MHTTKIIFIGAGSMSFGLSMFRDLFTCGGLAGSTLTLVDIDRANLDHMTALARLMNDKTGAGLKIEASTELRPTLSGAGFVINSTAIERNRLWRLDFEVPKKHGIRHSLGENGGPGGLFFTLRTLPLVFDFIHAMEELCPQAYFLNFSNPESRIILAIGKYSRIRCIGLCHGIFMSQGDIARILGIPAEKIALWGAGLNHFQWLLEIRHRDTGEDLYPLLREKDLTYDPAFMPLSRRLMRAFGKYPTCSDDHLGEYLAYGWEGGEHGYDFDGDERWRGIFREQVLSVLAGKTPLPADWLTPSGEKGAAVITGILHNQSTVIESGIVYNQGAIPNLPPDLAVEVPVVVDGTGIHPVSLGPLPDGIAKLLLMQASVQQLAVEAAVRASRELALQALLIDPVVNSSLAAEKILADLWEINQPYIRACIP